MPTDEVSKWPIFKKKVPKTHFQSITCCKSKALNQCGSLLYYFSLSTAPLSVVSPAVNTAKIVFNLIGKHRELQSEIVTKNPDGFRKILFFSLSVFPRIRRNFHRMNEFAWGFHLRISTVFLMHPQIFWITISVRPSVRISDYVTIVHKCIRYVRRLGCSCFKPLIRIRLCFNRNVSDLFVVWFRAVSSVSYDYDYAKIEH